MKRIICLSLVAGMTFSLIAQEKDFGISFSGFVKNDFIYDTRQNTAIREGHFMLWPMPEVLDKDGVDINARPNLNFLAIQSRLTGNITGPDALGAKTSAVIEGAFFGHTDSDVNGFRLRHAYGKMVWENAELIFGQTWNPLFITGCFPGVISFNTGAPFQPFSRNPQIRLTYKTGGLNIIGTAFTQRDFTSAGGSSLLRNSARPELNLTLSYSSKDENGSEILAGVSAGYKTLVPRLVTTQNLIADERVSSTIQEAFIKIKIPAITFKLEAVSGQNTYDIVGISSFALISADPLTDHREYAPLSSLSVWSEIHTNGDKIQLGLFGGYTKNLGAGREIDNSVQYGTRSEIDFVYRIAPRIIFNTGKIRFAGELEYTTAAWGTYNNEGSVDNSVPVSNMRYLIAAYYFF